MIRGIGGLIVALSLCATGVLMADDQDSYQTRVKRRGAFMGLDPGLSLRVDETGTPLYARLDLRLGGCFNSRVQLGADWRMELLVTGEDRAFQKRHEVGPVLTVFLIEGWFARVYAHVGAFKPFLVTGGAQTGYEFSMGKFSAIGFALGGDVDVRFDGEPPPGYSFSLVLYLTAYDLGTRRGRNKGIDAH